MSNRRHLAAESNESSSASSRPTPITEFLLNTTRNAFRRVARSGRSDSQSTNSGQRGDVEEKVAREEEGGHPQPTSEASALNIPPPQIAELRETYRRNIVVILPNEKKGPMTVGFDHHLMGLDLITQRACDRLGLTPITSNDILITPAYSGPDEVRRTSVTKVVPKLKWSFQGESRIYQNDFWVTDIRGSDAVLSYDSVANNRYLVAGNIPPY